MSITKNDFSFTQYKVDVEDGEIEGLLIKPATEAIALIVFTHGQNRFGAWEMFWSARRLLQEGYAVLMPSQLGFGESRGSKDYCGPITVDGIFKLTKEVVSSNKDFTDLKIAVWGASRGAIVSALLIGKYPSYFSAAVLQAGVYDMKADYEWGPKNPGIKENMKNETGATDQAFKDRSAVIYINEIITPLLIMHGTEDETISVEQSKRFAASLKNENELVLLEGAGHRISGPMEIKKYVLPFLEKFLKN